MMKKETGAIPIQYSHPVRRHPFLGAGILKGVSNLIHWLKLRMVTAAGVYGKTFRDHIRPGASWDQVFPFEAPGLRKVLNQYFIFSFLIVLALGVYYWRQNIPFREAVPFVTVLFALNLIPSLIIKEMVAFGVISFFPVLACMNGYGYSTAVSAWFAVLMNMFIISLLRRNLKRFSFFCLLHFMNLLTITYLMESGRPFLWGIAVLSGLAVSGVLVISLHFVISNEMLLKNKVRLMENLRQFVASVLHDYASWAMMSNIGVQLMERQRKEIHPLLKNGVDGVNALALRLKNILNENRIVFSETLCIADLLERLKSTQQGVVPIETACPPEMQKLAVRIDFLILSNCVKNLLDNSFRAGATHCRVEAARGGPQSLNLIISDNGRGMEKGVADKLFTSHVRGGKDGKGVGLLGVKFNLLFLGCDIHLLDPNNGGGSRTTFCISDIPLLQT